MESQLAGGITRFWEEKESIRKEHSCVIQAFIAACLRLLAAELQKAERMRDDVVNGVSYR